MTSPELELPQHNVLSPEQLGIPSNQYLDHPRWARILLDDSIDGYWTPTWRKDAICQRPSSAIHDTYERWTYSTDKHLDIVQEGYIGGFPRITNTVSEEEIDCLHMWYNNADTEPGQQTFPVTAIRAALLTTKRESSLRTHVDNLYMDNELSDRYLVPVLFDTKDGKLVSAMSKKASAEDIENAIQQLRDPLYYFGRALIPEELKEKQPDKVFSFVGLDGHRRGTKVVRGLKPQEIQELLDLS